MGGYLGRLRPRPVPLTLGPGDRPGRAFYPSHREPPALGDSPVGLSLNRSHKLSYEVQAAGTYFWQRSQRAVVAPAWRPPVEQARQLFLGVLSLAFWSGAPTTQPTGWRCRMSSMTLITASAQGKDSLHLAVQRSVQTVWTFLTDHLSSSHGNSWPKAPEDSSQVPDKEKEDPSLLGHPGVESAKKKENLPGTAMQGTEGRVSGGRARDPRALKRQMSKGTSASGMPKTMPGSLDRGFRPQNSANSPTSQSQTSKSPSSNRNAIASSYSSTLGLLPQRQVVGAARFPRPGAAKAAAPAATSDVTSLGGPKGAAPCAGKAAAPGGSNDATSPRATKAAAPGGSNDATSPRATKAAAPGGSNDATSPRATKAAAPGGSNDATSPRAAKGAAPGGSNDATSPRATKAAAPGGSNDATSPRATKAAAQGGSNDATSPGAAKGAHPGATASSAPRAAVGVTGDADALPHLASSQCQLQTKKPSESCQQTGSSATKTGKARIIRKIKRRLPRQVQDQDGSHGQQKQEEPCEASSDLPSPKRRKVVLLLPCRKDKPLVMPPAPDPGFPVTVEFYDAEKRAAIERLNKFLMGDSTKAQSN